MDWTNLRDVASSLLLGTACAGCDRPGRAWCAQCSAELHEAVEPVCLSVAPPVVVCCRYAGCVPEAIVGYKDRGIAALRESLGHIAAAGVLDLLEVVGHAEVVLVPVPAPAAAVRRRGFDHMWEVTAVAADTLGLPSARLLRSRRRRDQAALAFGARRTNVAGTMRVRCRGAAQVVVIDDVRTSGATLAECERALVAGGHPVMGHVVIASAI